VTSGRDELATRPDLAPLRRADLLDDPIAQIELWLSQAREVVPLAEAMTLATVDEAGEPDARMVLLRGVGADGLRFYTDYESAKGRQLAAHPSAALVVYWQQLDRQIRARGEVQQAGADDSDTYFVGRPRDARLAAWISPQSEAITSRAELERRYEKEKRRFSGEEVPRPPRWGGYVLRPDTIEFFQSQRSRLHDRFLYTRTDGRWRIQRLAP
jgi:pyridoxamine 5'-phosphate oxidase